MSHLTYSAEGEVRGSLYVDANEQGVPEIFLFGDFTAHAAYALHAQTGELLWKTPVHDHEAAIVTGSVIAHDGTVVSVSSLEVILASRTDYEQAYYLWSAGRTGYRNRRRALAYLHDRPARPLFSVRPERSSMDRQGAYSSSPTIDASRNLVYAGTGENLIPHLPTA